MSLKIYGLSKPYFQSIWSLFIWCEVSVTKDNFLVFSCLLLSLMKSYELFRALRCVGPIPLTLFMSNQSVILVGRCVSFGLESLVNNYLQVAWQRSQVDLFGLIWERTPVSGDQPYALFLRYLGRSTQLKKNQPFLALVPSLTKQNSIMKRKTY